MRIGETIEKNIAKRKKRPTKTEAHQIAHPCPDQLTSEAH